MLDPDPDKMSADPKHWNKLLNQASCAYRICKSIYCGESPSLVHIARKCSLTRGLTVRIWEFTLGKNHSAIYIVPLRPVPGLLTCWSQCPDPWHFGTDADADPRIRTGTSDADPDPYRTEIFSDF